MNTNLTAHTMSTMYNRTCVKLYLHKSLIGDTNFAAWRLFLSNKREIENLPFPEYVRDYQRKQLKKSKYGIAIDELGGAVMLNDMRQVIEAKIAPTWPELCLQYLQAQERE